MTLQFAPPFPTLLTLIIMGIVLSLSVRMAIRQRQQGRTFAPNILRLLTLMLLSALLLNPILTSQIRRPIRAPLAILLDSSRSMNTKDVGQMTRWFAAKVSVMGNAALVKTLSANYDLKCFTFAKQTQPRTVEQLSVISQANGDASHIANALLTASALSKPPASGDNTPAQTFGGVVLISDGGETGNADPISAARQCRANGLPVFTLTLGREFAEPDIQVTATRPQVFASPNQPVEISAEIQSDGITAQTATATLTREGQAAQTQTTALKRGRSRVNFTVTETSKGFYRYRIRLSPVANEADTRNNQATIALSVLDAKTRVLLLEGEPSWDAKFTAQALRSDPTLQLDAVYLLMDGRPIAQSGAETAEAIKVPQTLEEFARYDVLIIGKGYEAFFDPTATANLKRWITERGGNLVLLRGRADEKTEALRELEPFSYTPEQIEATRAQLTDAGKAYPGFVQPSKEDAGTIVQKLPLLITSAKVSGEKAMATVLARTEGGTTNSENESEMALLAWQRVGQGKVMAVAGDGLWRWAMLPPELAQYANVFPEFWAQTIRYLASGSDFLPGQNLTLAASRPNYAPNEEVEFILTQRGANAPIPPTLTVQNEQGNAATLTLSQGKTDAGTVTYRARITAGNAGDYLAAATQTRDSKPETATVLYSVLPPIVERVGSSADPIVMRQIAEAGGGEVLKPDDLSSLTTKLKTLERATQTRPLRRDALQSGWVFTVILVLLSLEWFLRRRG